MSQPQEHSFTALQNLLSLEGSLKKLVVQKENQVQKITVEYQNPEDARRAFEKLNNSEHEGLGKVSLSFSAPTEQKENIRPTLEQMAS